MVINAAALSRLLFIIGIVSMANSYPASAKNNPPGCKNPGAQVHNPNCSGGDGIHVPITPELPPIPIQTIPITPTLPPLPDVSLPRPITPTVRPKPDTLTPTVRPKPETLTPTVRPRPDTLTPSVDPNTPVDASNGAPSPVERNAGKARSGDLTRGDCLSGRSASADVPCPSTISGPGGNTGAFVFELNDRTAGTGVLGSYSPEIISTDTVQDPTLDPLLETNNAESGAPSPAPRPQGGEAKGRNGDERALYGSILVHVQRGAGDPAFAAHVPPKPGKNFVPGYRAYLMTDTGHVSTCVLSGMGRRSVVNQNGHTLTYGYSQSYSLRSATVSHLPANRRKASHCLVSIEK